MTDTSKCTFDRPPGMVDVAKKYGILEEDPLWPLMVAWDASCQALDEQKCELRKFTQVIDTEITGALRARTDTLAAETRKLDAEAERYATLARQIHAKTIHETGEHVAKIAEKAFTQRARSINRNTLLASALAAVVLAAGLYGTGHLRGYNDGFAIATAEGDARYKINDAARSAEITTINNNANEAARLFQEHPEELKAWAPLIKLNRLAVTSIWDICRHKTSFVFDRDSNQLACWLPLKIPTDPNRPHTMLIPGRLPDFVTGTLDANGADDDN
ncbi:hypothetical protein [Gluconobacter cerinus]|uniref:hypothetical protein n=1 Tax=Gluconobacter cerinus TaxID=38307 RepID=UPI003AB34C84